MEREESKEKGPLPEQQVNDEDKKKVKSREVEVAQWCDNDKDDAGEDAPRGSSLPGLSERRVPQQPAGRRMRGLTKEPMATCQTCR